ncbi:type II toxin-antitoxin system RelE/ParE family toxin [Sphingomonas sp.]|uniref:type II toxin-antitoxin system RelE/ParE family toxin n=1 Tax=Sphingomonas sp. TaxID=28214 RepID=UPI00286D76C7|nr:type II toxin-antitoxin system RelE/ParE family toxin [Sphingomonas sp.]
MPASQPAGRAPTAKLAKVFWSHQAIDNLDHISIYIGAFNSAAAERPVERLGDLGESLKDFPLRGRNAGDGLRELSVVWPYILRYRVDRDRVTILRIRHGAQDEDDGLAAP